MSLAQSDFSVFKNALVYTVTVQAVNKITDNRSGSVLTMVVTTALMTYGAQVLADNLALRIKQDREKKELARKTAREKDKKVELQGSRVISPLLRSAEFVTLALVSVGINMQSTLIGTYFGRLFDSGVHPLFILGSALVGLVLLWVAGVVLNAVP